MAENPDGTDDNRANEDGGDPEVPTLHHHLDSTRSRHHTEIRHHASSHPVGHAFNWVLRHIITNSSLWTTLATLIIAFATVQYTRYSGKQWAAMSAQLDEMRKSTKAAQDSAVAANNAADLNRQVAESTQAATLSASWMGPEITGETVRGDTFTVTFLLINSGKVSALDVRGDLTVSRLLYPQRKIFWVREYPIFASQIAPQDSPRGGTWGKQVLLEGHSPRAIIDGKEIVEVRATFQYENGFKRVIRDTFCMESYPSFDPNSGRSIVGFDSCARIPIAARKAEDARERYERDQAAKSHQQ